MSYIISTGGDKMPMSKILGCIKKADIDYDFIEDGDRIAIGISGGKDSMCLAEALRLYKFFSKKNYEIVCINIVMGFPPMDFQPVKDFFDNNGIEFHQVPSEPMIYEVLKLHLTNKGKLPCSICSKMKKAAICKAAHEFNCNKVAFAHHGDDAIETLLLNAIYGGRIATFKPKMELSREKLTFIRPLLYAREKDIKSTVRTSNIPVVASTCPNDKHTERESMKELLQELYHRYPEARSNFLRMLSNQEKLELWIKNHID